MTYIEELQEAIRNVYHVEAVYVETVPIKEVFQGEVIWDGAVEVFDLPDASEASRVYAWAHDTDLADRPRRTVTVLHIPPITSPEKAVRASIVSDYRAQQEKH